VMFCDAGGAAGSASPRATSDALVALETPPIAGSALGNAPQNEVGPTARGGEFSCLFEHSLKSRDADHRTTVAFQNLSSEPISPYWLDYSGKRIPYQRINRGDSRTQETYISHPWVLVDAKGRCRKIILPGSSRKVVTIR
jgi:hypothetical protein